MERSHERQLSESLLVGLLLAFVGGYLDGYTYLLRDGMFATMETSNLILAVYHFIHTHWMTGLMYLVPIGGFTLAVAATSLTEHFLKHKKLFLHWRQITLIVEIVLIIGASFIPLNSEYNIYSTLLLSIASGIQLESFRTIHSISFAANMATGNLQKIARGVVKAVTLHNKELFKEAMCFVGIVLAFTAGISLSLAIGQYVGCYTSIFSIIPLIAIFFILFKKPVKDPKVDEEETLFEEINH